MQAGIARRDLTPPPGVELAGLGYYLKREWRTVRDPLAATALVLDDGETTAALVAVDLMYLDRAFLRQVGRQVEAETGIPAGNVLVAASHSHNAPNAAPVRGVGERHEPYVEWAAWQAAAAVTAAWSTRRAAILHAGHVDVPDVTFNRTRAGGPVDRRLTVLRGDDPAGTPRFLVVNFAAHPTVMLEWDRFAVSRDYPGVLTDAIEAALPGCTTLFLQGSCGDVNFLPEFSQDGRWHEAGRLLADAALAASERAEALDGSRMEVRAIPARLPTRPYSRPEIEAERAAAMRFAGSRDTEGWREVLGRVMVNHPDRFPDRYGNDVRKAVDALVRFTDEWTSEMLADLECRDPWLDTEAWGLRIGPFALAGNGAELFSHWALDLRDRTDAREVMVAGYANDAVSYVPDAHDIEHATYAAAQSPKYMGRFPFTLAAGKELTRAMLAAIGSPDH